MHSTTPLAFLAQPDKGGIQGCCVAGAWCLRACMPMHGCVCPSPSTSWGCSGGLCSCHASERLVASARQRCMHSMRSKDNVRARDAALQVHGV